MNYYNVNGQATAWITQVIKNTIGYTNVAKIKPDYDKNIFEVITKSGNIFEFTFKRKL